jgi:putative transposase
MRLACQYKLLPTTEQKAELNRCLDMLRHQYNWLLQDRFDWWERNRCDLNACPLICHLPELRDNPGYYSQKRGLVQLKQDRPWYKNIHSQVLQNCVDRVKLACDRFIKGDCNGNRSGKPRFKGKGRYRSFTYTQMDVDCLQGNRITLPKFGNVKLILHRPIPDGFDVKTAIISKKADGWYVTLTLQSNAIPDTAIDTIPTWENSIGIDLGLEKFLADSEQEFEPIPQHFRKSEEKLALLQRKAAAQKKKSRAKNRQYRKVARLHQKVARQRKQFHFETAKKLIYKADVIFVEDLKVKNMSRRAKPKQDETGRFLPNGQAQKSGMNKSIADAGWSQFIEILSFKAQRAGCLVIEVDPRGTSQHCSECLNRVPKELRDRWHSCLHCGLELDRDSNSAILIKKVGLGVSLTIKRSKRNSSERSPRYTALSS